MTNTSQPFEPATPETIARRERLRRATLEGFRVAKDVLDQRTA